MQHYLYRIQPTRLAMLSEGPNPAEAAIVSEHFSYLQRQMDQGVVLMAGRTLNTDAESFGIVIFVAESDAAAAVFMENDPAVRQGVMHACYFPYRIALWSPAGPTHSS